MFFSTLELEQCFLFVFYAVDQALASLHARDATLKALHTYSYSSDVLAHFLLTAACRESVFSWHVVQAFSSTCNGKE